MTKQTRGLRRRLALAMLRLYPRAWRQRYEDEQSALIVDTTPTWRVLVDLARTTAGEWLSPASGLVAVAPLKCLALAVVKGYLTAGIVAVAIRLAGLLIVLIDFSFIRHEPIRPGLGGWFGLTLQYLSQDVWWGATTTWFCFTYALAFTSPVLIGLFVSGLGKTSPIASRIVWTSAATLFQLWLMVGLRSNDVHADVGVAVGAWVLAATLFPRRSITVANRAVSGAALQPE